MKIKQNVVHMEGSHQSHKYDQHKKYLQKCSNVVANN